MNGVLVAKFGWIVAERPCAAALRAWTSQWLQMLEAGSLWLLEDVQPL
jgi:hypothetical protein